MRNRFAGTDTHVWFQGGSLPSGSATFQVCVTNDGINACDPPVVVTAPSAASCASGSGGGGGGSSTGKPCGGHHCVE